MEKIPAGQGWQWIREGAAIFRKQPAELATVFLCYMFLMLALSLIPTLGQVLPLIVSPVFSMAFMQASVQVEQDKRVYPDVLIVGFRSPALHLLLLLGLLYLIAAGAALGASALIDNGALWDFIRGRTPLNEKTAGTPGILPAMLVAALIYTPAAMAFWYAGPLIMWQKMSIVKALFYSFFAVFKSGKAFLVYGLGWLLVGGLLPSIVSGIFSLFLGQTLATLLIGLPLSLVVTVIMYCSFYPTYKSIFGKPVAAQDVPDA